MSRKPSARIFTACVSFAALASLAGCKPDIPLVPFIHTESVPYGDLHEVPTITPAISSPSAPSVIRLDRSPQATPALSHTAPAAAPRLP